METDDQRTQKAGDEMMEAWANEKKFDEGVKEHVDHAAPNARVYEAIGPAELPKGDKPVHVQCVPCGRKFTHMVADPKDHNQVGKAVCPDCGRSMVVIVTGDDEGAPCS